MRALETRFNRRINKDPSVTTVRRLLVINVRSSAAGVAMPKLSSGRTRVSVAAAVAAAAAAAACVMYGSRCNMLLDQATPAVPAYTRPAGFRLANGNA
jgi:hypothetical protein